MKNKLRDGWNNVLKWLGRKRDDTTTTTYKGENNDS